jgi:hypothetical protein
MAQRSFDQRLLFKLIRDILCRSIKSCLQFEIAIRLMLGAGLFEQIVAKEVAKRECGCGFRFRSCSRFFRQLSLFRCCTPREIRVAPGELLRTHLPVHASKSNETNNDDARDESRDRGPPTNPF